MGRPSRHLSVRGIATAGLAALAVLCLLVAGGAAWIAALLQQTSSVLVRDTESLRLTTQIELQLLDFQRLSVLVDDPAARMERDAVERTLRLSLIEARRHVAGASEGALLDELGDDIDTYMLRRAELEDASRRDPEGRPDPFVIQRLVRPALSEALADLDLLNNINRSAVDAAYLHAQRVGTWFKAAAAGTVLLTLVLALGMALLLRRMLLRPILDLRETIERFRTGEPYTGADERAPRELSEIARAFNDMSAELDQQKSRQLAFIAGVAHDLRNPLAALQYGVDAIQGCGGKPDTETQQTLSLIGRQIDHLSRMVDDLLETSSIEAGELVLARGVFDLREAVQSVLDLYAPLVAGRRVELRLGDAPKLVEADRVRIEQVIGNLVSNAIKYSASDSPIRIELTEDKESVELRVADRGIGIAPEHLDQIFRPFWRAQSVDYRRGTGLGLSVVRKIVLAHGGTISVDSRQGAGSLFIVRIPCHVEQPEHAQQG